MVKETAYVFGLMEMPKLFQSPLGEVVKETGKLEKIEESQKLRFNPLSGKW